VNPEKKLCFNGGLRKVTRRQLDQTKGAKCSSMVHAFAKSQNIPFARWTDRHLNVASLMNEAVHWGFGHDNRLQLPVISIAEPVIPQERLAFAQTGAGFGEVPLSPLHGAVLAATVANNGEAALPKLSAMKPPTLRSILPEAQAKVMKKAMIRAVKKGSARRAFLERRRPAMGRLGAGGKTGSLFIRSKAGQDLSWFVGFAPADKPEIAVAAYVINGPKWRIRAPYVGREALRAALLKTSPYRPTQDPLLVQGKKKKKKVSKKSASRK
jgi:penicillin-binding protein A